MVSIFISYRRGISSGWAGRLAEKLRAHFGSSNIFMDVETLQPGADFVEAISSAVRSCDVLLAIIAPDWTGATTRNGRRRLDDSSDFVRIEIASALGRGIRVIPILVGGATMPAAADLPDDVRDLARRQAHELSDTRWDFDCQRLIEVLQGISAEKPAVQSGRAPRGVRSTAHDLKGTKPRRALALVSGAGLVAVVLGSYAVWRFGEDPAADREGPPPRSDTREVEPDDGARCTYGPGTCSAGFVWRSAYSGDKVCVTPDQRDQAAADNAQAARRLDPNGAYGSNSCVSGYVWRAAQPQDLVCVEPWVRDKVALDNSQAAFRVEPGC